MIFEILKNFRNFFEIFFFRFLKRWKFFFQKKKKKISKLFQIFAKNCQKHRNHQNPWKTYSTYSNLKFSEGMNEKDSLRKKIERFYWNALVCIFSPKMGHFLVDFCHFWRFFGHFLGSIFQKVHFRPTYDIKKPVSG